MGLGVTAAGSFAALVGREPQVVQAAAPEPATADSIPATADSIIVLWMAGGMAQTETFDPKRYTPYAPGVKSADVMSTFPAIPTAVDRIQLSQGLEKIAAVAQRRARMTPEQHATRQAMVEALDRLERTLLGGPREGRMTQEQVREMQGLQTQRNELRRALEAFDAVLGLSRRGDVH